jgi:hypothetical protein
MSINIDYHQSWIRWSSKNFVEDLHQSITLEVWDLKSWSDSWGEGRSLREVVDESRNTWKYLRNF